jgi:cell wall-associated NlpC family hydrolase
MKIRSWLRFLLVLLVLPSCALFRGGHRTQPTPAATPAAHAVLKTAKSFLGTPYKAGGEGAKGMDCSGLVVTSFKAAQVKLPRRSAEQAKTGKEVPLKEAKPGDLIFFATDPEKPKTVNHVGIVHRAHPQYPDFYHASSSKGVMDSSMKEAFFQRSFIMVRRVLPLD